MAIKQYPTLKTIIMVEEALINSRGSAIKLSALRRALPKQVNHNALKAILIYLEESGKIAVSITGISWIHNINPRLRREIRSGLEL